MTYHMMSPQAAEALRQLRQRANAGDRQAQAYLVQMSQSGAGSRLALMGDAASQYVPDPPAPHIPGRPMRGDCPTADHSAYATKSDLQDLRSDIRELVRSGLSRPIAGASRERELGIVQGPTATAGKGGSIYSTSVDLDGPYVVGEVVAQLTFPENFRLTDQFLCTWSANGLDDPTTQAKFSVTFTAGVGGEVIGGQSRVSLRRGGSTLFETRTAPMVDPSTGVAPRLGSDVPLVAEIRANAAYDAPDPGDVPTLFLEVIGGSDCMGFQSAGCCAKS